MAWSEDGYIVGEAAGTLVQEKADVLRLLESGITHPTHSDGFVDKGDPIVYGASIVGVAWEDAAAATDYVNVKIRGIFNLSVAGTDDGGDQAVAIGDIVMIQTADAVLNLKATGTIEFGVALGAVTAGATTVIPVLLSRSPVT